VRVAGQAFYSGRCEFISEAADPFADGFVLPARFIDVERPRIGLHLQEQ
jgi:proline racemase